MMPAHPVLWIEKGFNTLWEDSLAAVAQSCHWNETAWVARLAILNTIFSAEAAANCCIASLANQTQPWKAWKNDHRSETLKKFDHYLRETKNKALDMASPQVRSLVEAFELRNSIVHRRKAVATLTPDGFKRSDEFFTVLNIPRNPEKWSWYTAKKILLTVSEFFEFFFVGCCGQTQEQTYALLQDWIDQPSVSLGGPVHVGDWYPGELKALLDKKAICPKWVAHLHQEPDHD